jgi:hypothetical protein
MKKLPPTFLVAFTLAVAALAGPRAARAQDGAAVPATTVSGTSFGGGSFGQAGQWVYSIAGENEFPFSLSKTGDGDWSLTLRPGVDYFIIRSLSIGGIVALHKDGGASSIGLGARVGYNIPITSLVSFWARGGVFVNSYDVNNGPNGVQTSIGINAPFLFHVLPHAFAGVGPFFSLPVQDSDAMAGKDATFGLTAILGGWL